MRLVSPLDENFHCENCNAELVAESDKLAAEELGDGEDNARRRRREKLKDLYERLEVNELLSFISMKPEFFLLLEKFLTRLDLQNNKTLAHPIP